MCHERTKGFYTPKCGAAHCWQDLKRTLKSGPVEGLYWIEVPRDLLSKEQLGHEDCGPFFFAVELEAESVCFELLIRSQVKPALLLYSACYTMEQQRFCAYGTWIKCWKKNR